MVSLNRHVSAVPFYNSTSKAQENKHGFSYSLVETEILNIKVKFKKICLLKGNKLLKQKKIESRKEHKEIQGDCFNVTFTTRRNETIDLLSNQQTLQVFLNFQTTFPPMCFELSLVVMTVTTRTGRSPCSQLFLCQDLCEHGREGETRWFPDRGSQMNPEVDN